MGVPRLPNSGEINQQVSMRLAQYIYIEFLHCTKNIVCIYIYIMIYIYIYIYSFCGRTLLFNVIILMSEFLFVGESQSYEKKDYNVLCVRKVNFHKNK